VLGKETTVRSSIDDILRKALREVAHELSISLEDTRPRSDPPTEFLPGSIGKIEVMRQRADCGLPLFHPRDASYEGYYGEQDHDIWL
jgi:hypothetical protein